MNVSDLVNNGSVMKAGLRADTVRAETEYKNQLKNAGDIYVGTGEGFENDGEQIYITEGKNIQTALNEDFARSGKIKFGYGSNDSENSIQFNTALPIDSSPHMLAKLTYNNKEDSNAKGTLSVGGVNVNMQPINNKSAVRVAELKQSALLDMSVYGTEILSGDLNDYMTVGNYYCSTYANVKNIKNKPSDFIANTFTMRVYYVDGNTTIGQEFIGITGVRWTRYYSGVSWTHWLPTAIGGQTIGSESKPVYVRSGFVNACNFSIRVENSIPTDINTGDIVMIYED